MQLYAEASEYVLQSPDKCLQIRKANSVLCSSPGGWFTCPLHSANSVDQLQTRDGSQSLKLIRCFAGDVW